MQLPYGVTGFYSSNENPPPLTDGKEFKKICYVTSRSIGGKLLAFKEPEMNRNFYEAIIEDRIRRIHILLNVHYPFVAFAASVEYFNITFIDEPAIAYNFQEYDVLDRSQLDDALLVQTNKEFTVLNENSLNTTELNQIKKWGPKTIGEVIFNFWD